MENKCHLIDCMEFMSKCKDNQFQLSITDPPYGIERFKKLGSRVSKFANEKLQEWNSKKPSKKYFDELFRISKYQIIWGANNFELPISEYFIVWQKHTKENFSFSMCEQAWTNIRRPAMIFKYMLEAFRKNRIHPTQKPVALYKWLLQKYAKPGWKIFDSHVGSGSIRIACHDMGFDFEGCEIDKDYWEAQEKRYNNYAEQGDLFNSEDYHERIFKE